MSLGFFDNWHLGCPERFVVGAGEDGLMLASASVAAAAGERYSRQAVRVASLRRDAEGLHSHLLEQLIVTNI